jgi:hypothetical protein
MGGLFRFTATQAVSRSLTSASAPAGSAAFSGIASASSTCMTSTGMSTCHSFRGFMLWSPQHASIASRVKHEFQKEFLQQNTNLPFNLPKACLPSHRAFSSLLLHLACAEPAIGAESHTCNKGYPSGNSGSPTKHGKRSCRTPS